MGVALAEDASLLRSSGTWSVATKIEIMTITFRRYLSRAGSVQYQ